MYSDLLVSLRLVPLGMFFEGIVLVYLRELLLLCLEPQIVPVLLIECHSLGMIPWNPVPMHIDRSSPKGVQLCLVERTYHPLLVIVYLPEHRMSPSWGIQ